MRVDFDDKELVSRLKNSDEASFRIVFDQYHRRIYQFAYGFLKEHEQSEEVVQEAFLNFWLYRNKLSAEAAIASLLFTMARRVLIDHWRKCASSNKFKDHLINSLDQIDNSTEILIESRELERVSKAAFQLLTEQQREIFILSREEGLTYNEIAERMQISRHTVKYHLTNALDIIRQHFAKHGLLHLYSVVFLFL